MSKDMVADDFFREYSVRAILNLNYKEYKSLKEETKIVEVNYDYVLEKLSWAPDSEILIKMELEDEFANFGK